MTRSFERAVATGLLAGVCDPAFARVADVFEENFRERDELGASVCIIVDGQTVVDLWGGTARLDGRIPWDEHSVSVVWSSTKGAVSLCTHMLAARGVLDLDARVTDYWPEFGGAGKQDTTVGMILSHQSGLCAWTEPIPAAGYLDRAIMVRALERQRPFFTPGTAHGYQAFTYGWLLGEIIERVTGRTLGTFFDEEVATPLGIPFWIGLPAEFESRTARMILPAPEPGEAIAPFLAAAAADDTSPQFLLLGNLGGYIDSGPEGVANFDSRPAHAAEIGSAGGITNARGLAGMYAPLAGGGRLNGVDYVDPPGLARMGTVASAGGRDFSLLIPTRFSPGFFKTVDNRRGPAGFRDSLLLSEAAFGHPGFGGSIGFADPPARLSFGYTMNRMGQGTLLNARGQSLVDAVYASLGYRLTAAGGWIK